MERATKSPVQDAKVGLIAWKNQAATDYPIRPYAAMLDVLVYAEEVCWIVLLYSKTCVIIVNEG